MTQKHRWLLGGGVAAASLGALLLVAAQGIVAADHLDPPTRTDPAPGVDTTGVADAAADIADIYAFHDDNFVYILDTFGGPSDPSLPAFYDRNVLHTINVSFVAPDTFPEITMHFRFGPGQNPNEFGIEAMGVPGANGTIVAPVERTTTQGTAMLYAGLRDDPFFFDSQGLRESRNAPLTTPPPQAIRFNSQRSFFHGKNITVIAVAIRRSELPANAKLHIWSTSSRFGGQI